jgi:hypothetical protein
MRSTNEVGVPTILAVGNQDGFLALVEELRMEGYLVLVAATSDDAVHLIRVHSREIHVLVTLGSVNPSDLVARLMPFRVGVMQIVCVMGRPDAQRALREVRRLVQPPKPPN